MESTRLHEALVIGEYGEYASDYVRAQIATKAFEAIGLPSLSICERPVDELGRLLDFDGRLMREKTSAALHAPVADFELSRRGQEHSNQLLLDTLEPGEELIEDSMHPDVEDSMAAAHGYSPEHRYLMKRLYKRTEDSIILYTYNIPHGVGKEGITIEHGSGDTTIEGLLEQYDKQLYGITGQVHFLGQPTEARDDLDYREVELSRLYAERKAARHISFFERVLANISTGLKAGSINESEARKLHSRFERGLHTLLLVELNPEQARRELSKEDYAWMNVLLEFDPEHIFKAAFEVAERNRLVFVACGGMSTPEGINSWHGGEVKLGICEGCSQGPKPVGAKNWCKDCISGHCGAG